MKSKRCFFFHRYERNFELSDKLNDSHPYFAGGLKVYVCSKCSKPKLVYPPDAL